jgi:hypothetical protein
MLILGIETSCDDTSAAVVEDGRHVRSNVIRRTGRPPRVRRRRARARFARAHLDLIGPTVRQALADAGLKFTDLDGVAVTFAPGLMGSLIVGVSYAKALALALGRPLVASITSRPTCSRRCSKARSFRYPRSSAPSSRADTRRSSSCAPRANYAIVARRGDGRDRRSVRQGRRNCWALASRVAPRSIAAPPTARADRFAAAARDERFGRLRHVVLGPQDRGERQTVERAAPKGPPYDDAFIADVCASFQEAGGRRRCSASSRRRHASTARVRSSWAAALHAIAGCARDSPRSRRAWTCPRSCRPPRLCADNAAMIALVGTQRLARGERDGPELEPVANLDESGLLRPEPALPA